jgi:hypothetical protein
VMELAPYVLVERGASLEEMLSFFLPNGYSFFDERTDKPLPSTVPGLREMVGGGASINVIARVA